IAGQPFNVVQAGVACSYSLSAPGANVGATAASGTVSVTADTSCGWSTSTSDPLWLTCSPANGTGSGVVTWSVAANSSCTPRSGTLTIAGQRFTINQAASAGSFSILPASAAIGGSGGSGSVNVTATSGCYWIASSPVSWITTSANGNGNGTAGYTVAANSLSSTRSATLTIAGQPFLVTQAGMSDSTPPTANLSSPTSGSTVSGIITL